MPGAPALVAGLESPVGPRSEPVQPVRISIGGVECEDGGFIMTTRIITCLASITLLLTGGPVLAHDRGGHVVYPDDRWSGALIIRGDSYRHSGWSGSLNYVYGLSHGYAPGYIPWVDSHQHGPSCRHWTGRSHAKAYQKGYRHGKSHSRKSAHRHGHHH